jgi:DNA-binding beta-propeller fold protein YncE
MFALIYLGSAIALGDLLCRRFYRFVSIPHRWAAAILVGVLLSAGFTYLAVLAFAHTSEPLLFSDLLFFVIAPGAIFLLARKGPRASMIEPRAPGSSTWDWITLGALFGAACISLVGTLYVNKQGLLRVSMAESGNLAPQLSIAQTVALSQSFAAELPKMLAHGARYQFLFYLQAGNLEFLGLNLAWSIDVLSVLGVTSMLALVMAFGELLFISRVVGRLGATLFFFHGSLQRLINFLAAGYAHRDGTWGSSKPIAFVNQRQLPFAIGIFLVVLIFLVDWYRQRSWSGGANSDANGPLLGSKRRNDWNQLNTGLASRFIASARHALKRAKSLVFSGLLLAALLPWNVPLFIAVAVVLCCLLIAYGFWRFSTVKRAAILGRILAGTLTACILAAGVMDLFAVYRSSCVEVNFDNDSLVKGLVFRRSVIYKIPDSFPSRVAGKGSPKLPVTAFEGGHGSGRGEFDNPHGLAVDNGGNIFVADTGNGRIEKFSPNGAFVTSMGRFEAPSGIAIDRAGNIYVAEVGSKHCVQKLGPDGTFIAKWAPALYGPRKIAVGPDDSIYVVDSGRNRIVKFSPDGRVLASWGREGSGDGQFRGVSSVAVDPTNKVYTADPVNRRIQVFDSNGKFLKEWSIPEWGEPRGFEDLAIDSGRNRLYASSGHMASVLIFDLNGTRLGNLTPKPPNKLEGPSALALSGTKLYVLSNSANRVVQIDL